MRLIDADALKETIHRQHYRLSNAINTTDHGMFTVGIDQAIDEQPTIDAVSVKRSFWESYETSAYGGYDEDGVRWLKRRFFRCERCRKGSAIKSNFCPNCGADMRERKDGEG